ncbi:MAG: hypothetical protein K940chlam2_01424, partial [Chlamydiae bacterium]|nr:hypothetical protein [Chlamydiota bacterium]
MLFRHLLAVILSISFPFWTSHQESAVKEEQGKKTVLLSILARNKAHVLPTFLRCIDNLDYDKSQITLYINTNNNEDNTEEIHQTWAKENEKHYRQIVFESHEIDNMIDSKPHEWTPT